MVVVVGVHDDNDDDDDSLRKSESEYSCCSENRQMCNHLWIQTAPNHIETGPQKRIPEVGLSSWNRTPKRISVASRRPLKTNH